MNHEVSNVGCWCCELHGADGGASEMGQVCGGRGCVKGQDLLQKSADPVQRWQKMCND